MLLFVMKGVAPRDIPKWRVEAHKRLAGPRTRAQIG